MIDAIIFSTTFEVKPAAQPDPKMMPICQPDRNSETNHRQAGGGLELSRADGDRRGEKRSIFFLIRKFFV